MKESVLFIHIGQISLLWLSKFPSKLECQFVMALPFANFGKFVSAIHATLFRSNFLRK